MIDHVDYAVARVGNDHVGFGSDFNHGGGIEGFVEASDAPRVTASLIGRGYGAEDVERIWGGNFLRAWRAVERSGGRATTGLCRCPDRRWRGRSPTPRKRARTPSRS